MSTWYQYDSVEKDVLIRLVEDNRYHCSKYNGRFDSEYTDSTEWSCD